MNDKYGQHSAMDMSIFKNLESNNCVVTDDTNDTDYNYIENCDHMKRIAVGMKYYDLFCKNKVDKEIFHQFCQEIYTNFLDDYFHFISVHDYHSIPIAKELERVYGLTQYDINSGDATGIIQRHYRTNAIKDKTMINDETDTFYRDSFDRLYHHIFLLNVIGLRDDAKDKKEDKEENKVGDIADDEIFDVEFMKMKQRIFKKRDKFLSNRSIERFGSDNNKFDLVSKDYNNNNHEPEKGTVDQKATESVINFMKTHQFDSDAFKDDLNTTKNEQSNVYNISDQNMDFIATSNQFIRNIECQIFGYWLRWKVDKKKPAADKRELFGGYSRSELWIKELYGSIKEEVFESGFVDVEEWSLHLKKAKKYMDTDKVKKMKSWRDFMEYGILESEIPITLSGILSIILYCDTNKLQNNFSCSFRKKSIFETLSSLKQRHQKYYHWAKNIVTVIKVYGERGCDGHKIHAKGPFYCGLSVILNIGSFAIYLKAPTSTTKDISVAINFATRNGQIMEIQNDTPFGQFTNMLDCSWISNYSEENERLWVGNQSIHRLRIESIRIIKSNHNHKGFFNALHVFDSILSGETLTESRAYKKTEIEIKVSENSIKLLSSLIKMKVCSNKSESSINEYILNCFNLYLLKKTNIILKPRDVYENKIPFLFFERPRKESKSKYIKFDGDWKYTKVSMDKYYIEYVDGFVGTGLLDIRVLQAMFPNLNHIKIDLGFDSLYNFDLLSFLKLIQDSKIYERDIKYHIQVHHGSWGNWLSRQFNSKIKRAYKDAKVKIKYEKMKDDINGYEFDHIWINY